MRMQMMQQQQQQQQGMPRPPPPDYKTPMMSSGVASQPGNTMMNQQQSHHMMPANQQQQQNYAPAAIRPGIRPSMVPAAQQPVAVGHPSPNGATSPMLQQQQQQRGMVNYPQQGQQPMMGKIYYNKNLIDNIYIEFFYF